MDCASRRIRAFRLSNTLTTDFCVEALEEAMARHGNPEIVNTDQGSQFTSLEFTGKLESQGIAISMDGKGAWRDNVFVERFWKTLKYGLSNTDLVRNEQTRPIRLNQFENRPKLVRNEVDAGRV